VPTIIRRKPILAVCQECGVVHGLGYGVRERTTRETLERWRQRLFDRVTWRFDFETRDKLRDRILFEDVETLLQRIRPIIVLPPSERTQAKCIGTICTVCCDEQYNRQVAEKVSSNGIWDPCSKCGYDALARAYEVRYEDNDLIRAMFPWTGNKERIP